MKQEFMLRGPFWDGFRKGCLYVIPFHFIIVIILGVKAHDILSTIWFGIYSILYVTAMYLIYKDLRYNK